MPVPEYLALFEEVEPGEFLVTFPDVPEALTQGDGIVDARAQAGDALAVALDGYAERGRPIPQPVTADVDVAPGVQKFGIRPRRLV
jgi:antitoxin HicB